MSSPEIGRRARSFADAATAFLKLVESLDGAQWQAPSVEDGRPIGTIAHHVALGHAIGHWRVIAAARLSAAAAARHRRRTQRGARCWHSRPRSRYDAQAPSGGSCCARGSYPVTARRPARCRDHDWPDGGHHRTTCGRHAESCPRARCDDTKIDQRMIILLVDLSIPRLPSMRRSTSKSR